MLFETSCDADAMTWYMLHEVGTQVATFLSDLLVSARTVNMTNRRQPAETALRVTIQVQQSPQRDPRIGDG